MENQNNNLPENIMGWEISDENGTTDLFYQKRGDVLYDDEHDETPDPELWIEAKQIVLKLQSMGMKDVYRDYSEKGWIEVYFEIGK